MVKLRPFQPKDHERLIAYAFACSEGLTSMPKDRSILEKKLRFTQECFEKGLLTKGESGLFLFVIENETTDAVGMSAIKTYVSPNTWSLTFSSKQQPLEWVEIEPNLSELCSLYLDPQQRHHLWGKALSYCRFFFIQKYPLFFAEKILAQLRGWILPSGDCPFWDEIKFLSGSSESQILDFKEAHQLVAIGKTTVRELLPGKLPSLEHFSSHLQRFIGQAHEHTAPAERLLQEIHFHKQHRIDPLDGGPQYEKDLLSCSLMSCIHEWKLKSCVSEPRAKHMEPALTLIEVSKSSHPCDFELELVTTYPSHEDHCLFLEPKDFERVAKVQAKALTLEPFHHPSSRFP